MIRPQRRCDSCGHTDDHPRCNYTTTGLRIVSKHIDCCHHDGCPGGLCTKIMRASGFARGEALVAFLEGRMAQGRDVTEGWDQ